jgi:glycosyltransferase involved in cell wall biosynthesis
MRIAFIVQRLVFPPDAGTPIRNYNLIAQAARQHQVYVFGFTDERRYPTPLDEAGVRLHLMPAPPSRNRRERLAALLTTPLPDMAWRSRSKELLDLLRSQLPAQTPDIVQVQALDMAYTIPTIRQAALSAAIVLDEHNAEYVLQRRALALDSHLPRRWPQAAYSFLQWQRLRRYEREVCTASDLVVCVSSEDVAALERLGCQRPLALVPNGVDLAYYQAVPPAPDLTAMPGPHFVFPGKMDFRPNVDAAAWLAERIFPLVRARLPGAHLWLVGREPLPSVQALAALPAVHVTGEVLDVRPYIAAATAVVVPLRLGGGTKLKLLEAAALRRPLVTTPIGAEGYREGAGRDYLLAEDAAGLAQACVRLADDPALASRLAESAYQNMALPNDWSHVFRKLEVAYERARAR